MHQYRIFRYLIFNAVAIKSLRIIMSRWRVIAASLPHVI